MQFPDRTRVDVTVQHGCHQLTGLFPGERFQVQPQQQLFLPQRGHRIGRRRAVLDGDDQLRGAVHCQLLDQQRRKLIEMLRVVDHDDETGFGGQRLMRRGEHHRGVVRVGQGERVQECPERNRLPGLGAQYEPHRVPVGLHLRCQRASQRRLAHAGATGQHHTTEVAAQRLRGLAQFGVTCDKWPVRQKRPPDASPRTRLTVRRYRFGQRPFTAGRSPILACETTSRARRRTRTVPSTGGFELPDTASQDSVDGEFWIQYDEIGCGPGFQLAAGQAQRPGRIE
nr:hypothetical protein CPGR_01950 [Mycolicibacterium fortuitum subsp. fortuitum DSM 46621 = ATCC 6841 = JCM 6387]